LSGAFTAHEPNMPAGMGVRALVSVYVEKLDGVAQVRHRTNGSDPRVVATTGAPRLREVRYLRSRPRRNARCHRE